MRARFLGIILAGCSYDWTVGLPPTGGAGGEPGGGASGTSGGASAGGDGGTGGEGGEPPDCPALVAAYEDAVDAAKECEQLDPDVCTTPLVDLCGCKIFLAYAGAPENDDVDATMSALERSGCDPGCERCGPNLSVGACSPDGPITSCAP